MQKYSFNMKKHSFKLVREHINLDETNITHIKCTGKSFMNIFMTILLGLCSFACLTDFASIEMFQNVQNFLAYLSFNSIFLLPFFYMILKIKNYYFLIENDNIKYRNFLGIIYEYTIRDIKHVNRLFHRHPEVFVITMENNKIIIISDYSTNFKLLKLKFLKEKLLK